MLIPAACEREVEALYEFFVEWFCGECEQSTFETVRHTLVEPFEPVEPNDSIDERVGILAGIRQVYDTHESDTFDIAIRTPIR